MESFLYFFLCFLYVIVSWQHLFITLGCRVMLRGMLVCFRHGSISSPSGAPVLEKDRWPVDCSKEEEHEKNALLLLGGDYLHF